MIRRIKGEVAEIRPSNIVIDVSGIGYLLHTKSNIGVKSGELIDLWTYLSVRENSLDLYGFLKKEELETFELLIGLPKIGPKSALQILNQAEVNTLREAAYNNDPSYLSKLSGIGKKSAEKIVAGLKDKIDKEDTSHTDLKTPGRPDYIVDTIEALVALGYSHPQAREVVISIGNTNSEVKDSTEALKLALRLLSN